MKSFRITVLTILAAALTTLPAHAAQEQKTDWYVITNLENRCKSDKGPSKLIEMLQTLKQPYEIFETEENGEIISVRVEAPSENFYVTYYNGKQQCELVKAQREAKEKAVLDRYQ